MYPYAFFDYEGPSRLWIVKRRTLPRLRRRFMLDTGASGR